MFCPTVIHPLDYYGMWSALHRFIKAYDLLNRRLKATGHGVLKSTGHDMFKSTHVAINEISHHLGGRPKAAPLID